MILDWLTRLFRRTTAEGLIAFGVHRDGSTAYVSTDTGRMVWKQPTGVMVRQFPTGADTNPKVQEAVELGATLEQAVAYVYGDKTVIYNLGGVPWSEAPLPPRQHTCYVHTRALLSWFTVVERCACGGICYDHRTREGHHWMDVNDRHGRSK